MRILHVASEVAPWAQTGGLSDVVGALPPALAGVSSEIRTATVAPLYRAARTALAAAGVALGDGVAGEVAVGGHRVPVRLRPVGADGRARVWLVEADPLYDRDGLYEQPGGGDWPDNALRYAVLARAAVDLAPAILGGAPDVIHGHDWQAGLATAFARWTGVDAATVLTIHNLAYRGVFPKHVMDELGLPWAAFDLHHLEFYDQVSFLKAGLAYADVVTTVSPTYAHEILTPERGEGLDGFLRHDVARLVGIANGIDQTAWDPARDQALPARFDAGDLTGKAATRAALAAELGLQLDAHTPLAVAVARMTSQKGLDLLADLVPELRAMGVKLAVLGAGEPGIEDRWRWLGGAFAADVAVRIGFDPALARRLYGGADLFVMPSRFEPCGLGQLYAMRYGAVPVVAAVGGLRDTVIDAGDDELALADPSPWPAAERRAHGTGFRFEHVDLAGLRWALGRAVRMFRDAPAAFAAVRAAGMRRDSSWDASAREYVQVYRAALRTRR